MNVIPFVPNNTINWLISQNNLSETDFTQQGNKSSSGCGFWLFDSALNSVLLLSLIDSGTLLVSPLVNSDQSGSHSNLTWSSPVFKRCGVEVERLWKHPPQSGTSARVVVQIHSKRIVVHQDQQGSALFRGLMPCKGGPAPEGYCPLSPVGDYVGQSAQTMYPPPERGGPSQNPTNVLGSQLITNLIKDRMMRKRRRRSGSWEEEKAVEGSSRIH